MNLTSVNSVSSPVPTTAAQPARRGHHAHASKGTASAPTASTPQPKASETLEQLARQGDPTAIAELKADHPQQTAAQMKSGQPQPGQQPGAKEPGKGGEVDVYA